MCLTKRLSWDWSSGYELVCPQMPHTGTQCRTKETGRKMKCIRCSVDVALEIPILNTGKASEGELGGGMHPRGLSSNLHARTRSESWKKKKRESRSATKQAAGKALRCSLGQAGGSRGHSIPRRHLATSPEVARSTLATCRHFVDFPLGEEQVLSCHSPRAFLPWPSTANSCHSTDLPKQHSQPLPAREACREPAACDGDGTTTTAQIG